jgi:hypothetical protein
MEKQGRCANFICGNLGKVITADENKFICPICKLPLESADPIETDSSGTGGGFPKWIIYAAAAVLVIGGIVTWLLFRPAPEPVPEPPIPKLDVSVLADTVSPMLSDTITKTAKDTIIILQKDTIVIQQTDTVVIKEEKETVVVTPEKSDKQTKNYPFGKYVGSLKNGYPEGIGSMYYNKRVQIAKYERDKEFKPIIHYAEAGDYILDGTWANGDIVVGFLYDKNGNLKQKIAVSRRDEVYDISND